MKYSVIISDKYGTGIYVKQFSKVEDALENLKLVVEFNKYPSGILYSIRKD